MGIIIFCILGFGALGIVRALILNKHLKKVLTSEVRSLVHDLYEITYVDAEHVVTTRKIRIESFESKNDDWLIMAFCFKRNDIRQFYASRIQKMISIETGEVIDRPLEYINKNMKLPSVA